MVQKSSYYQTHCPPDHSVWVPSASPNVSLATAYKHKVKKNASMMFVKRSTLLQTLQWMAELKQMCIHGH